VDTDRQLVLAQDACSGPYNGSAMLRPLVLVDAAHEVTPLGVVLADSEFDSEHNHRHVHEQLAGASVIPTKRGKATWQVLEVTGPRCEPPYHVSCTEGGRWQRASSQL
jgi:hypothetical protein